MILMQCLYLGSNHSRSDVTLSRDIESLGRVKDLGEAMHGETIGNKGKLAHTRIMIDNKYYLK